MGENVQRKAAASEIVQILSETATPSTKSEPKKDLKVLKQESETPGPKEKLNFSQLEEENVSYRTLRRIGMIIKTIKACRFRLLHQIAKYINEEEIKEGVTSRVDRATINRLLQKLEKDELIKIITLTGKEKTGHTVKLYTDPTFEPGWLYMTFFPDFIYNYKLINY